MLSFARRSDLLFRQLFIGITLDTSEEIGYSNPFIIFTENNKQISELFIYLFFYFD